MNKMFQFVSAMVLGTLSVASIAWEYNVSTAVELQEALDAAAAVESYDTITIAPGTYFGTFVYTPIRTDTTVDVIPSSLTIIGAGPNSTILDADGQGNALSIGRYNYSDIDVIIDGVAFINGSVASDTSGGAGLLVERNYGEIEVRHCRFEDNTSLSSGGGALLRTYFGSSINVDNSIFLRNSCAGAGGGGLYAHSAFSTEQNISLTNSLFDGNSVTGGAHGGGAHTSTGGADSGLIFHSGNRFMDNSSEWDGGGANIFTHGSDVTLVNNLYVNNSAPREGSDLYVGITTVLNTELPTITVVLTNNTVFNNIIGLYRSLLVLNFGTAPTTGYFYNNIVWSEGARTDIYLGRVGPAENPDEAILSHNNYMNLSIAPSLIVDDTDNNTASNPNFVSAPDDLSLLSDSLLIDAGLNAAMELPATDLVGEDRIINNYVDLGAYEYASDAPQTSEEAVEDIIDKIVSSEIAPEVQDELLPVLESALDKINDGKPQNDKAAIKKLLAFIRSVSAKSGDEIPVDVAEALIEAAELAISFLEE